MEIKIPVTKYMSTQLITFTPDVDIREATRILLKNNISGAPVVDKDGKLIGILSERDCIQLILDGDYNQIPYGSGTVRDYMSTQLKTIDASKTIVDAAYEFVNTPYRRFPVLEDGKLVGQISRRDILKAIDNISPKKTIVPDSWKPRKPQI
ncbi:MAG TPA: CBS domain-containing protein [Saprospiraceae bacterium]|nr:CBS domain-containing protein [Saprospiraceae bacterium]